MIDGLKLLMTPDEIRTAVERLAREIRADYASRNPLLVGVLKGAFVFLSDLVRALDMELEVDFIQAASYGKSSAPSKDVLITGDLTAAVKGRDVIIVEGIIDRGETARAVASHIAAKGPASIRLCTLILRDSHSHGLKIDYVGKKIDKGFVVGYGMDYKGRYRNLPGIYTIDAS